METQPGAASPLQAATYVPPEPKGSKFFAAIAVLVIIAAVAGGAAAALYKIGWVPSDLWKQKPNEDLIMAGNAQTAGNYDEARKIYEEQLTKTRGEEQARVQLRLAVVDLNQGNVIQAVNSFRQLSQNTSISTDLRARAAITAVQAYNAKRDPQVRDALFQGEGWSVVYPKPFTEGPTAERQAVIRGFSYALSIGDLFYTRFLLARYMAEDALALTGTEQKVKADEAFGNLKAGLDLLKDPKNYDNWPPAHTGYMLLEANRAMVPLFALKKAGVITDDTILNEANIRSAFEKNIAFFDTWNGRDILARPYGMLARFFYAAFLNGDKKNADATNAQLRGLMNGYLLLSAGEKVAFPDVFQFVKIRSDEAKFGDDTYRKSIIALGKQNAVFKQFLIDQVGGWVENDFK